ncbi:MAG: thiamine diphosphokinase [Rhodobacteraceae bacterium]|nr:thiamine diphosphokinase [Paracoccaceae bacterium]
MSAAFAKPQGITLVGGGATDAASLRRALDHAPHLVAVDGGADAALATGLTPEFAIGDFDSITDAARAALGPARLRHDPDQETTDFDKALAAVEAPLILAVGFSGGRLDHTLAAISTLAANPHRRVVLDSGHDLTLICPPRLAIDLAPGTRVSLYPLAPVRCASTGLVWPTDPLDFDPRGRIGTSNAARGGRVTLAPSDPAMLLLVPVDALAPLIAAVADAPSWPAPARAR